MLEDLGVFGIDADKLAHRMIYKGAPAYLEVLDEFGDDILLPGGEIDRAALGKIVFNDQAALMRLEGIIHPHVRRTTTRLVEQVPFSYIVVEAIKLLESSISSTCDTIWTSHSDPELQLERLLDNRGMDQRTAIQRIESQPPQSDKTSAADFVIDNNASFWEIWEQVEDAFTKITADSEIENLRVGDEYNQIQIYRCTLYDIELIFDLLAKFKDIESNIEPQKILDDFASTAYLILKDQKEALGMVMWQYENFLSVVDRLIIQPEHHNQGFVGKIIHALDSYFSRYMAEANILHLPEYGRTTAGLLSDMGYREINPSEITSAALREVVSQKERHHKHMWIKDYTSTANQAVYGDL